MTEDEWLAGTDLDAMAAFVSGSDRATPRVRRLFMAAFWIGQLPHIHDERKRITFLERIAQLETWAETGKGPRRRYPNMFMDPDVVEAWNRTIVATWQTDPSFQTAKARQVVALREIFGNPFHPIAFDPAWCTDTVVSLAKQMYEAREFSAMPILADALQDAGCDNEDVLCHCRDTSATHVRGAGCGVGKG
jgi:hypothetical protein